MRQIFSIKRVIEIKKREELEVEAKLHNMQVKGAPVGLNVSQEERKEYDDQATKVHERLKKKHKERQQHGKRPRTTDKDKRQR